MMNLRYSGFRDAQQATDLFEPHSLEIVEVQNKSVSFRQPIEFHFKARGDAFAGQEFKVIGMG